MTIEQALAQLDSKNDDHWTAEGLPRVEVVSASLGVEVTRKDITNAAPTFSRKDAKGPDAVVPKDDQPAEAKPRTALEEIADNITELVGEGDEVVGMPPAQVMADVSLIDRALDEWERQAVVLSQIRDFATEKLKELGARSAQLNAIRARLAKALPKENPIQDYLAQQRRNREQQAARTQSFLARSGGVEAAEVAKAMSVTSPIDRAMSSRRGRGQRRPVYPPAGTVQ